MRVDRLAEVRTIESRALSRSRVMRMTAGATAAHRPLDDASRPKGRWSLV